MSNYIRFFSDLNNQHTSEVGGKNASLGEMIGKLGPKGIRIPAGFATTAQACWDYLEHNGLREKLTTSLDKLDQKDFKNLGQIGKKIRQYILEFRLKTEGKVITSGTGIGEKITRGVSRVLASPDESNKLQEGDILITDTTNPDWDNVMKKASAIVTNSGAGPAMPP